MAKVPFSKLGIKPNFETVEKIFTNAKGENITYEVNKGTVNRNNITHREIVTKCLLCEASNLVIAHNHPSGVIEPSREDVQFSKTLKMLLLPLDIKLCDHLIIAGNRCHSIMPLIDLGAK